MRLKSIALAACLVLATATAASSHGYEIGDIEIGHPWSRATPPNARVAAGYATIKNTGSEADRLVSVTSDISGSAEVHEMSVGSNGVMTMRPLAGGVEIPAGGEVRLEPGALHIMFMNPDPAPKEGGRFKGTLTFEKAGAVEVEFAVEAMGGEDHSAHGD